MEFKTISKRRKTTTMAWRCLFPFSVTKSQNSNFQLIMISDRHAPINPKIPPLAPCMQPFLSTVRTCMAIALLHKDRATWAPTNCNVFRKKNCAQNSTTNRWNDKQYCGCYKSMACFNGCSDKPERQHIDKEMENSCMQNRRLSTEVGFLSGPTSLSL